MIGIDLPEGIYHACVAVQTEDLFLSPADGELAAVLNVLGVCEVQGSEAGLGQVNQEDNPPFAKINLPHFVTSLKLEGGDDLVGLRVSNCDHVVGANFRCVTETLLEKLKWTGSGMNSYSGIKLCGATSGTWSTKTKVLSSGL